MEYEIKLTEQEIRIISAGLVELAYKHASPVLNKIQKQVDEQEPKPGDKVQFPMTVVEPVEEAAKE